MRFAYFIVVMMRTKTVLFDMIVYLNSIFEKIYFLCHWSSIFVLSECGISFIQLFIAKTVPGCHWSSSWSSRNQIDQTRFIQKTLDTVLDPCDLIYQNRHYWTNVRINLWLTYLTIDSELTPFWSIFEVGLGHVSAHGL